MKIIIKHIIILIIQLIEKIEFKYNNIDENNPLTKIHHILTMTKKVKSDYAYTKTSEIVKTVPLTRYKLKLENGYELTCADSHIVYCDNHIEKFVIDLTKKDYILTDKGLSKVKYVKKLKGKLSMFDLTIDNLEPSYYTNNILSHNTVSASIVILHYILFNSDKGVMIVANKSNTVKEIIRKIKDIYKLLPFFLKQGVLKWDEKSLTLENGCRIQTENRTKEPSIGFTVDFLYLDEFAKVPSNIIDTYYGTIVPTVSSVKNSKIVITSTPEGFNLFHKLYTDAIRDEEDPLKNQYTAMKVYWWQVEGRLDVELFPLAYRLKEYNIDYEFLRTEFRKLGYEIYDKKEDRKNYIYIKYDKNDIKTEIDKIRQLRIQINDKQIPLDEICIITNWKEKETKLIGGESMFKKEYDLQFVTGDKLLVSSDELTKLKMESSNFEYLEFTELDNKLTLPYKKLKWLKNKLDIFNKKDMKKYHIFASVDLGEGLGGDYSVINIFRLIPKPKELIEINPKNIKNIYDFFYLVQIGMFRVNNWDIGEVAEIFYLLFFELFDSEKVKIVLEYNTFGETFLTKLPYVFDENNDYNSGIFLRYFHKKDDKKRKIGIKVTKGDQEASKRILIKGLQNALKNNNLKIYNDIVVDELSVFVKKSLRNGNYTYAAETGNDDTVMTIVNLSTVFGTVYIKNFIDDIYTKINIETKQFIDKILHNKQPKNVDYSSITNSKKQLKTGMRTGSFRSKFNNRNVNTYKSPWSR